LIHTPWSRSSSAELGFSGTALSSVNSAKADVASIIKGSNEAIDALSGQSGTALLTQLAQVAIVAQGDALAVGMNDQVQLLEPWATSAQQVVARQDSARIDKNEDLAYRQIALKRSSPVWGKLTGLMEDLPGMDIVTIPESMTEEEILNQVKTGKYDLTVMDSLYLKSYLPEYVELSAIYNLTEEQQMILEEAKEFAAEEDYNTALEKIWEISNSESL